MSDNSSVLKLLFIGYITVISCLLLGIGGLYWANSGELFDSLWLLALVAIIFAGVLIYVFYFRNKTIKSKNNDEFIIYRKREAIYWALIIAFIILGIALLLLSIFPSFMEPFIKGDSAKAGFYNGITFTLLTLLISFAISRLIINLKYR